MSGSFALCEAVRSGNRWSVDQLLQQPQPEVNSLNECDVSPLHIAVWRNSVHLTESLLEAGADPDLADGESGWTSLHRALYWGHLRLAARLLRAGASTTIVDQQGRGPLDLVSTATRPFLWQSSRTNLYSWGSGANYQLGTGSAELRLTPARVDTLSEQRLLAVAAAKYHSCAVTQDGRLYTWGWGRSGRLGHRDIHCEEHSAEIHPRQVMALARRQVVSVAAAKHHTLAATSTGEVFSWGSNRHGQLGGQSCDTQPVPKRVSSLRANIVQVAAANKHSAALSAGGALYTWGDNGHGQLGYGTCGAASNPTPRCVEALKGRALKAVSVAKRHSVALTEEGEVLTWGHKAVHPRKVALQRLREGCGLLHLHSGQWRPEAVAVAAGATLTCCVTRDGAALCWNSADASAQVVQMAGPLSARRAVSVSAAKERVSVVTEDGDVFYWEGRLAADSGGAGLEHDTCVPKAQAGRSPPAAGAGWAAGDEGKASSSAGTVAVHRIEGLKRAVQVATGEKYTLALQAWWAPPLPSLSSASSLHGGAAARDLTLSHPPLGAARTAAARLPDVPAAIAADDAEDLDILGPLMEDEPGEASPRSCASDSEDDGEEERDERGGGGRSSPDSSGDGGSTRSVEVLARCISGRGWDAQLQEAGGGGGGGCGSSWGSSPVQLSSSPWLAVAPRWSSPATSSLSASMPRLGMPPPGASPAAGGGRRARPSHGSAGGRGAAGVPDLRTICQRVIVQELTDFHAAFDVLELADAVQAGMLKQFSIQVLAFNLDAVLQECRMAFWELPESVLEAVEACYRSVMDMAPLPPAPPPLPDATACGGGPEADELELRQGTSENGLQEAWAGRRRSHSSSSSSSSRRKRNGPCSLGSPSAGDEAAAVPRPRLRFCLPGARPSAVPPHLSAARPGNAAAMAAAAAAALPAGGGSPLPFAAGGQVSASGAERGSPAFVPPEWSEKERLVRNLLKRFQQIQGLEARQAAGTLLDHQQLDKVGRKAALLSALHALHQGTPAAAVRAMLERAKDAGGKPLPVAAAAGQASSNRPGGKPTPVLSSVQASSVRTEGAAQWLPAEAAATPPGRSCGGPGTRPQPEEAEPEQDTPVQDEADSPWSSMHGGSTPRRLLPTASGSGEATPPPACEPQLGFQPSAAALELFPRLSAAPAAPDGSASARSSRSSGRGGGGSAQKGAQRKGGLSLFLKGGLDSPTHPTPGPLGARSGGPAWSRPSSQHGEADDAAVGAPSLRDILAEEQQQQQAAASSSSVFTPPPAQSLAQRRAGSDGPAAEPRSALSAQLQAAAAGGQHPQQRSLGAFVRAKQAPEEAAAKAAEPAWGGWGAGGEKAVAATTGASPSSGCADFREILAEQQRVRRSSGRNASGSRIKPASSLSLGQSPPLSWSVPGSSPPSGSKWFVSEDLQVRSLADIQAEEAALAQLQLQQERERERERERELREEAAGGRSRGRGRRGGSRGSGRSRSVRKAARAGGEVAAADAAQPPARCRWPQGEPAAAEAEGREVVRSRRGGARGRKVRAGGQCLDGAGLVKEGSAAVAAALMGLTVKE